MTLVKIIWPPRCKLTDAEREKVLKQLLPDAAAIIATDRAQRS